MDPPGDDAPAGEPSAGAAPGFGVDSATDQYITGAGEAVLAVSGDGSLKQPGSTQGEGDAGAPAASNGEEGEGEEERATKKARVDEEAGEDRAAADSTVEMAPSSGGADTAAGAAPVAAAAAAAAGPPGGARRRSDVMYRLLVHARSVSTVIGRGGSSIREVEAVSGARVQIMASIPGCEERVVIVSLAEDEDSAPHGAQRALHALQRLLVVDAEPLADVAAIDAALTLAAATGGAEPELAVATNCAGEDESVLEKETAAAIEAAASADAAEAPMDADDAATTAAADPGVDAATAEGGGDAVLPAGHAMDDPPASGEQAAACPPSAAGAPTPAEHPGIPGDAAGDMGDAAAAAGGDAEQEMGTGTGTGAGDAATQQLPPPPDSAVANGTAAASSYPGAPPSPGSAHVPPAHAPRPPVQHTVRLLVTSSQAERLTAEEGAHLQQVLSDSHGAQARVLAPEETPLCGLDGDRVLTASGSAEQAMRALLLLAVHLRAHPPLERPGGQTPVMEARVAAARRTRGAAPRPSPASGHGGYGGYAAAGAYGGYSAQAGGYGSYAAGGYGGYGGYAQQAAAGGYGGYTGGSYGY